MLQTLAIGTSGAAILVAHGRRRWLRRRRRGRLGRRRGRRLNGRRRRLRRRRRGRRRARLRRWRGSDLMAKLEATAN